MKITSKITAALVGLQALATGVMAQTAILGIETGPEQGEVLGATGAAILPYVIAGVAVLAVSIAFAVLNKKKQEQATK